LFRLAPSGPERLARVLVVLHLSKEFPTPQGPLPILKGVDLQLGPGDAMAITGPSGAGKSTLLYILGLLDQPTSGTIQIGGEEPLKLAAKEQAAFRNRRIGFVFQDHHLLPQCNVLENVLIPALGGSGAGPEEESRAKSLLQRVGLAERLTHKPAQLSGGERQRVAVCRALINRPNLLLADEPTGSLDQETAQSVGTLLLEIAKEQQAILICVTHSADLAGRFPQHHELRNGVLSRR
jgi:lipoprotein-releasing system ATP-binding protein